MIGNVPLDDVIMMGSIQDAETAVLQSINEIFGIPLDEVSLDTSFKDLHADSLDLAEVVVDASLHYDVPFNTLMNSIEAHTEFLTLRKFAEILHNCVTRAKDSNNVDG